MFKAIQLKQTERALHRFAKKVIDRAKWNLANRKGKPGKKFSRGPSNTREKKLSDSLGYSLKVYPSGAVELLFGTKSAKHHKYVEYGRKAGKKAPPPSVLRNWIRIKPLKLRDLSTGKFITKNESNINSAAYLIGKAISEKGIPPRWYWRDAFTMHWKRLPKEVIKAYASDVAKFLRATGGALK
jgi:hypothetical protein